MEDIKYIYFEVHSITGAEISSPTIENVNVLLIKPRTCSTGNWGFVNMTERKKSKGSSYLVVEQNWIDLEVFNKYPQDRMLKNDVTAALNIINEKLRGILLKELI